MDYLEGRFIRNLGRWINLPFLSLQELFLSWEDDGNGDCISDNSNKKSDSSKHSYNLLQVYLIGSFPNTPVLAHLILRNT